MTSLAASSNACVRRSLTWPRVSNPATAGANVTDEFGEPDVEHLTIVDYFQRPNENDTRREYFTVRIPCTRGGDFTTDVPLFHTDTKGRDTKGRDHKRPVTKHPDPEYNWGEVMRVYPPSSPEFKYLYGARNDTEARHNDLKARIKNFPSDVPGQELRLLGAAIMINACAWAVHLQAQANPTRSTTPPSDLPARPQAPVRQTLGPLLHTLTTGFGASTSPTAHPMAR